MKQIMKLITGIIIIFLLVTLTACKASYEKIPHLNYKDLFSVKENEYYVYIYRPGCTICPVIEEDIYNYYKKAKKNKNMPNLYVLNKGDIENNGEIGCDEEDYVDFVGATSYRQIHTYSSPFLIKFRDGTVINTFDGKTLILEELNKQGV